MQIKLIELIKYGYEVKDIKKLKGMLSKSMKEEFLELKQNIMEDI